MKVDGVFAGGGVKAFAFIGALQVMEEKGYQFDRLAGTSAGSIVSALIKVGYKSDEIFSLLDELDVESFKDERMSILPVPFAKWIRLYFKLGLYKGRALEEWLVKVLEAKGVKTFGDIPDGSLKIIASDISKGKLVVLPDDLKSYGLIPEKFPIARAVRMSCSIPYFFEPVTLYDRAGGGRKSYLVDGGVLSNFPMWLFMDGNMKRFRRPVIGFRLTPRIGENEPKEITNAIDMFRSLFNTMITAHDNRYIVQGQAENIVFIPVSEIKATEFDLTAKEKEQMIILGKEKTTNFLKKWSY